MSPSALEGHDSNQAHSILGEVVDLLHNPYGGFLEGLSTAGYQGSNLADEQVRALSTSLEDASKAS